MTGGGAASGGLEYGIVAAWRRASHTRANCKAACIITFISNKQQAASNMSFDGLSLNWSYSLLGGQATIFLHNIPTLTNTTNYATDYTSYKLLYVGQVCVCVRV